MARKNSNGVEAEKAKLARFAAIANGYAVDMRVGAAILAAGGKAVAAPAYSPQERAAAAATVRSLSGIPDGYMELWEAANDYRSTAAAIERFVKAKAQVLAQAKAAGILEAFPKDYAEKVEALLGKPEADYEDRYLWQWSSGSAAMEAAASIAGASGSSFASVKRNWNGLALQGELFAGWISFADAGKADGALATLLPRWAEDAKGPEFAEPSSEAFEAAAEELSGYLFRELPKGKVAYPFRESGARISKSAVDGLQVETLAAIRPSTRFNQEEEYGFMALGIRDDQGFSNTNARSSALDSPEAKYRAVSEADLARGSARYWGHGNREDEERAFSRVAASAACRLLDPGPGIEPALFARKIQSLAAEAPKLGALARRIQAVHALGQLAAAKRRLEAALSGDEQAAKDLGVEYLNGAGEPVDVDVRDMNDREEIEAAADGGAAGLSRRMAEHFRKLSEAFLATLAPYGQALEEAKVETALAPINALGGRLAKRAVEIACAREREWMQERGLWEALSAARIGTEGGKASGEAVLMNLLNPEEARAQLAAAADPAGALGLALAKAAGVRRGGADPEALLALCKESLAHQGLSAEAFEACVASPALRGPMAKVAAAVFRESPKKADPDALAMLRVCFRALSHWAGLPESERRPESWMGEALAAAADPSSESAQDLDEFSSSRIRGKAQDISDARRLAEAGETKAAASGALSLLALEMSKAKVDLRRGAEPDSASREGKLASFANFLGRGASPRWDLLGSEPSLDGVRFGLNAGSSAGFSEAWDWGERERAAICAAALSRPQEAGEAPRSANDWVRIGKEVLEADFGIGAGPWKKLATDAAAAGALRAYLEERAQSEAVRRGAVERSGAKTDGERFKALGLWMSHQARMSLDKTASETIGAAACGGSPSKKLSTFWLDLIPGQVPHSEDGEWVWKIGSVDEAKAAIEEIEARDARIPHVAKALCERLAALTAKDGAEAGFRAFSAELDDLRDWLSSCERGVWSQLPEKPTWNSLRRAEEEWHRELGRREAAKAGDWEVLLPEGFSDGAWLAIELKSGSALAEEGKAMRHCVSSYAGRCRSGESRIYSIRRNGERICTMELNLHDGDDGHVKFAPKNPAPGSWKIVQNRGVCNALVGDPAALAFCLDARDAANKAYAELVERVKEEKAQAKREAEALAAAKKAPKPKG